MAGLPTPVLNLTNTGQNKGLILQFAIKMKLEAYAEDTRVRYERALITLSNRSADLLNPESVKQVISTQKWLDSTKRSVTDAVLLLYKYNNLTAILPKYKQESRIPFIPQEAELDQLIAGCKHQMATFLQILKETAVRYGEAFTLKWKDYDTEAQTLSITPEKGSLPRQPTISAKLQLMLSTLPHTTDKIFVYGNKQTIRKNFQRARKRIAKNLGNPRLLQIHFHTFRHWKASTEFHDHNNAMLVMKLLGHKCLNNTQRYIQLFPDRPNNWISEISYKIEDDQRLTNQGYDFVTERDKGKLFRKRK